MRHYSNKHCNQKTIGKAAMKQHMRDMGYPDCSYCGRTISGGLKILSYNTIMDIKLIKQLAVILHSNKCCWSHVDQCSWDYEMNDWTREAHKEYLKEAEELIKVKKINELSLKIFFSDYEELGRLQSRVEALLSTT